MNQTVPESDNPERLGPASEGKDDDSRPTPWYTWMGIALVFSAIAGGLWWYITDLEQQGGSRRVHWVIALLYNVGGKWLTVGVFAAVAVLAIGLGVKGLVVGSRDR